MKTKTVERHVVTNAGQRTEFKIAEDAKIFHMLISGLYSNKPQSITREIWSNARDAHAEAGILDRPFDVTFPSVFNPVFKVRDYGAGMTHEEIMELYTSLGTSTKEDDNTGVGKFGIGSKSPFSYTDTFSVVVYRDGKARFYTAIIENGGIPAMHMMAETDTEESNGIEVSFPVQTEDVKAFRKAAQRVAHGFDVKPNIVGLGSEEAFEGWTEFPVLTEGKGWRILSGTLEGYGNTAYAKMGCVLYPIDVEPLENLTSDEKAFLQSTLIIDFEIGDLEITPSRENLSYGRGEPTADSIQRRVREIVKDAVGDILNDYDNAPSYWEACRRFSGHMSMPVPKVMKDKIRRLAAWNGESLTQHIKIDREKAYSNVTICALGTTGRYSNKTSTRFDYYSKNVNIDAQDDTLLIIEDLSLPMKERVKYVTSRIKLHSEEEEHGQYVWIKYYGKGSAESQELQTLLERLDGIKILDLATLPKPSREARGPSGPVKARFMSSYRYRAFQDTIDVSAEEMEEGGFVVPIFNNAPENDRGINLPGARAALVKLGVLSKDTRVYGAPKTIRKRFEGDQWEDFGTFCRNYYENNFSADPVRQSESYQEVRSNGILQFISECLKDAVIADDSPMKRALDLFEEAKDEDEDISAMRELMESLNRTGDRNSDTPCPILERLEYIKKEVEADYPLLNSLARHCRWDNNLVDKLVEYIYMCDKANETKRAESIAA